MYSLHVRKCFLKICLFSVSRWQRVRLNAVVFGNFFLGLSCFYFLHFNFDPYSLMLLYCLFLYIWTVLRCHKVSNFNLVHECTRLNASQILFWIARKLIQQIFIFSTSKFCIYKIRDSIIWKNIPNPQLNCWHYSIFSRLEYGYMKCEIVPAFIDLFLIA